MSDDRLVLHGSFTSSSSYKPMLFLALAGLPSELEDVLVDLAQPRGADRLAVHQDDAFVALHHCAHSFRCAAKNQIAGL